MKHHTEPDNLTLTEIMEHYATEEKAREFFEALIWPEGPVCPRCGHQDAWKLITRPGLYECKKCSYQFTVTIGTIFESSHIPLHKWLVAWYIYSTAKKGISALQMQRTLGLGSYRSAWFMVHRIRHVVASDSVQPLEGIVEMDETYVGGVHKGGGRGFRKNKTTVVSLVERGGNKRSMIMHKFSSKNIREAVKTHVEAGTRIHTDEHRSYVSLPKDGHNHQSVNHKKKQYTKKAKDGTKVMTNTVESSFAIIKRAIYGNFHHISEQHMPKYLAEFDHKWNTRKQKDGRRCVDAIRLAAGKRLTYWAPKMAA